MEAKDILLPALRQYRHNTGEGLLFGYDKEAAEKIVSDLDNYNFEMRGFLAELNIMVRRGYVDLGENMNYQLYAMFGEPKDS